MEAEQGELCAALISSVWLLLLPTAAIPEPCPFSAKYWVPSGVDEFLRAEREEEGFGIGERKFWNLEKKMCLEQSKLFPEKMVLTTASTESIDFQLLVNLRTDSVHLPTSPVSLAGPLAPHLLSVLLFSFVLVFTAVCSFIFLTVVPPVMLSWCFSIQLPLWLPILSIILASQHRSLVKDAWDFWGPSSPHLCSSRVS